jgi:hypothetical protein
MELVKDSVPLYGGGEVVWLTQNSLIGGSVL